MSLLNLKAILIATPELTATMAASNNFTTTPDGEGSKIVLNTSLRVGVPQYFHFDRENNTVVIPGIKPAMLRRVINEANEEIKVTYNL